MSTKRFILLDPYTPWQFVGFFIFGCVLQIPLVYFITQKLDVAALYAVLVMSYAVYVRWKKRDEKNDG